MPSQLERMRFLIDNPDFAAVQLKSDSNAARTLESFWWSIEERPLQSMAGEPTQVRVAGKPLPPMVSAEHRFNYTVHGATCGSCAGGCAGAYAGYTLVQSGYYEETGCGTIYVPPVYSVNVPVLLVASIGATAVGALAGYAVGGTEDRKPAPAHLAGENTHWRNGCAAASFLPAVALGLFAGFATQSTLYGREGNGYSLNTDEHGLSVIPAVLTGLCVSVEVVTISYHVGRMIDRNRAKAAKNGAP
jgi:hypothetical protein